MKHATIEYILSHFHPSTHAALRDKAIQARATHIVLACNMQPTSPWFGTCTVLCVGPLCVYRTLAECEGGWLYDELDKRQGFTHYAEIPADWQ